MAAFQADTFCWHNCPFRGSAFYDPSRDLDLSWLTCEKDKLYISSIHFGFALNEICTQNKKIYTQDKFEKRTGLQEHGLQNLQIFRPDMGTAVTGHTAPAGALPAITAPPATFEQKEAKAVMPIENGVVVESQPVENAVKKDEMELSPEEQASKMLAAFTKRAADKKDADGKSETTTPKARGRPKGTGRKAKAKAKAKAMAKKNKSDKDETKKNQVKKSDVKKGSAKQGSAKKKDTKKSEKGVEFHDREYWRSMGKEARKVHRPHGCYKCRWSPGCSPSCFG